METILDRILEKNKWKLKSPEIQTAKDRYVNQRRSLIKKLQNAEEMAVIAEFKRASPSKGLINTGVEPAEQAKIYEKYGASAISVLNRYNLF